MIREFADAFASDWLITEAQSSCNVNIPVDKRVSGSDLYYGEGEEGSASLDWGELVCAPKDLCQSMPLGLLPFYRQR